MRIAILSDIHDHTTHLLLALHAAREAGCEHLLCLGDLAMFSTFRMLCEEWTQALDVVFGNNEYDRQAFYRVAEQYPHVCLHGDTAELRLGQRLFFMCHLPWTAQKAAQRGIYDAVFYGHTHCAAVEQIGKVPLINPGEIYGRQEKPGFAVLETQTLRIRHLTL